MPRVLLVDDDLGTRETFCVILKLNGWTVCPAASGGQALALAGDFYADVALVDVRLPDMTGIEVLRFLLTRSPSTKCVMMTGFGSVQSAVQAMKSGAHDYVEKPLSEAQLVSIVRAAGGDSLPQRHLETEPDADSGQNVLDWRVATTLRLLRERSSEIDLSIGDISALLRISPEHLSRLIKRDTGESFLSQLHRIRIEKAQRLLAETQLSVKEIASRVGYSSTTRLDVHFRRWRGITPCAFRRQDRGSNGD